MATWYTRREIAARVALLSTAVPLSSGLSGLIAAAVFATLEGRLGLGGWQWLFVSNSLRQTELLRVEMVVTGPFSDQTSALAVSRRPWLIRTSDRVCSFRWPVRCHRGLPPARLSTFKDRKRQMDDDRGNAQGGSRENHCRPRVRCRSQKRRVAWLEARPV